MTWSPGTVRATVYYRYWCPVCRSGSGHTGSLSVAGEAGWQAMHERTNYHRSKVAHFLFHHLTR